MKFPLLEARLNAYVPSALKIARFVILAVVVAFIVDAWTPFDLGAWVSSDAGARLLGRALSVAVIVTLALLAWLVVASWIEFRLNPQAGMAPNPRARTLLTIFRNAIAIALVVVTTMVVLAEVGINIAPLLAGAGVLGLAIGFGAQKLVQDVITGVFIQLERAIDVGDLVTAGGITGTVERMTIRSLGLRDMSRHLPPAAVLLGGHGVELQPRLRLPRRRVRHRLPRGYRRGDRPPARSLRRAARGCGAARADPRSGAGSPRRHRAGRQLGEYPRPHQDPAGSRNSASDAPTTAWSSATSTPRASRSRTRR